jgi:cytosolic carboxypeptidase protein 2/3
VLIFDSRFECGNLRKVAKVNNIEYNLWLENDTNTRGHTQWFYFKVAYRKIPVRAEKKTHKIRFNILNLAKTASLYQEGMKPCIWSKKKNDAEGTQWFRGGENVFYRQNNIPRSYSVSDAGKRPQNAFLLSNNGLGEGASTYFTLSFEYVFEANKDEEVWFAHGIPYTYTDMNR